MAKLWLRATPEYTQSGASIHASTSNAAKLPEVKPRPTAHTSWLSRSAFPFTAEELSSTDLSHHHSNGAGVSVGGFC
eukprot:CAMPEP_0171794528 /NCGR_PEP_ID=MMETSP0991-20121206/68192_1 /TAXON_ID=483369 /ORGANISM="non described non described, Strain CCMP2098" /LENGTH=76 /DNA_ID=CAMNT_0012404973 /DNA_START=253 /DNA_END=483 /DNA_ORIENTATION=+